LLLLFQTLKVGATELSSNLNSVAVISTVSPTVGIHVAWSIHGLFVRSFVLNFLRILWLMFELGLSVNIFGLNGEIPVAINPGVTFDDVTG
jgi:hypothetical protein